MQPEINASRQSTHAKATSAVAMRPRSKRVPQPLEVIDIPNARLTVVTVSALTGLGRATIHRRVKEGLFPQPIQRDPMCTRWLAKDISDYLAGRTEVTQ